MSIYIIYILDMTCSFKMILFRGFFALVECFRCVDVNSGSRSSQSRLFLQSNVTFHFLRFYCISCVGQPSRGVFVFILYRSTFSFFNTVL